MIQKSDQVGDSTLFVEFMLRCLLYAMDNYEDDESELHDKLHDKYPQLSEKAFDVLEILKDHPAFNVE